MSVKIAGVNNSTKERSLGKAKESILLDLPIAKLLVPLGTTWTAAQIADPLATVKAGLRNDDPTLRWQLVGPFEGATDKSKAPTTQTMGYGREIVTDRGHKAMQFDFYDGGFSWFQKLMEYKNKQSKYGSYILGKTGLFRAKNGSGFPLPMALSQIWVNDIDEATISAVAAMSAIFEYKNNADLNENHYVLSTELDWISELEGVGVQSIDYEDVTAAGASSGVFSIAITAGGGIVDLVKEYGATIAATALFKPTNKATGAAITITSAALNAAGNAINLTLDTTDTDYPAAGDDISIDGAVPSVYAGLDMDYFEVFEPLVVAAT